MIEPQYLGVPYRQIAARLRIQRPGRPHLESERPRRQLRDGSFGRYLDSDENPTLITFDADCDVDVAALLRSGAIAPYAPPAPEPDATEEGGADGGTSP